MYKSTFYDLKNQPKKLPSTYSIPEAKRESCFGSLRTFSYCVFPENIQTPTTEGISNRTPPPTPSDFPFAQGNVNPSPHLEFPEKYHPPPTPSGKFFPSFKRIQELINTKSKSRVSMGIHLIIYFINDPKAALSERRKLAQTNINSISLHKIMPKTYTIMSTLGGVSHKSPVQTVMIADDSR